VRAQTWAQTSRVSFANPRAAGAVAGAGSRGQATDATGAARPTGVRHTPGSVGARRASGHKRSVGQTRATTTMRGAGALGPRPNSTRS